MKARNIIVVAAALLLAVACKKSDDNYPNSIYLVGVHWCIDSTPGYYTFGKAQAKAEELSKRLPTKEEFEALCKLPQVWDNNLKGRWFAERTEDLGNHDKSLFFPAAGCTNYNDILDDQGSFGRYWSGTQVDIYDGYALLFDSTYSYQGGFPRAYGLSIRCVYK